MTDTVRDPVEPVASSGDAAHDGLVQQFDVEVAPRLESFRRAAANDPERALRQLYETGEEVDPQAPPVRRTLQRVAAGMIECQLMARFATLHFHWPDPQRALAEPELCRTMTGVGRQEIERAGEMLGGAIVSAAREAAEVLDHKFDPEAWADVLTEILRPARPAVSGACEVHDIETLRLIRDSKDDCFIGGGFSSDDPDDAA